ncbi:MAG: Rap1a/Tai family immunity protein [Candidatus Acidiferrales bacterium]
MKGIIAIAILVIAFSGSAFAQQPKDWTDLNPRISGNEFLSICPNSALRTNAETTVEEDARNVCLMFVVGYAEGINDGAQAFASKPDLIGNTKTNGQLYDIVSFYIVNHPAERDKALGILILAAMVEAYPKK